MRVAVTSGRGARPLVVLLACAAVFSSSAGAVRATHVPATQRLVVLLRAHVVRAGPAVRTAAVGAVPGRTPLTGVRTVLPVLVQRGRWLKVQLPGRPNGHTGWIERTGTLASFTAWRLRVSTSRRLVTVYRAGRFVRTFSAIVGKPSTPTPLGRFFVEESVALPPSAVGAPVALALSARSKVLQEFDGGPGQIALHGLDNVGGTLGTAISHGCVRLADATMRWLAARIPAGTPVTIAIR
jgi:lipoprotein-anchoring transpeptidase ErfK/SrfK